MTGDSPSWTFRTFRNVQGSGDCRMAWEGSTRRSRLPRHWPLIRESVLRRDGHRCQVVLASGRKCLRSATEVDHIIAGDNHDESNLSSICSDHHRKKSAGEGYAAMNARRREIQNRFRRSEDHPSLM